MVNSISPNLKRYRTKCEKCHRVGTELRFGYCIVCIGSLIEVDKEHRRMNKIVKDIEKYIEQGKESNDRDSSKENNP